MALPGVLVAVVVKLVERTGAVFIWVKKRKRAKWQAISPVSHFDSFPDSMGETGAFAFRRPPQPATPPRKSNSLRARKRVERK